MRAQEFWVRFGFHASAQTRGPFLSKSEKSTYVTELVKGQPVREVSTLLVFVCFLWSGLSNRVSACRERRGSVYVTTSTSDYVQIQSPLTKDVRKVTSWRNRKCCNVHARPVDGDVSAYTVDTCAYSARSRLQL